MAIVKFDTMDNKLNIHDARALWWWNALAIFTVVLSLGIVFAILYLPGVPLNVADLGTLVVFFFYPVFYFLDVVRFIELPDYGMGAMAMIVTVPVGILWVACITSLTRFGPGKWWASNGYYDVVRHGIILFGATYFVLCVATFAGLLIF
jgi:hypothetical protein